MCYLCMQAARDGQEDLLEHFLEHCMKDQIDALDKEGYAALHYAVKYHRVNIIRKLLTAKCGKLGTNCTIIYTYMCIQCFDTVEQVYKGGCC